MKLIAHRGYVTKYIKENTMEAFTNAFNNDFIGIEFDVRKTKDGKLVICHDAFIDRVSSGSGLISFYTYDELLKFNFGSKKVPSKIPLLKTVLEKYKNRLKLVELKVRVDLEEIMPWIDDYTYFISFDSSYMFKLKKLYPNLHFGVLNYVLNSTKEYDLDSICLLDDIMTDHIFNYFEEKKVKIFVYGVFKRIKYESEKIYYIAGDKM